MDTKPGSENLSTGDVIKKTEADLLAFSGSPTTVENKKIILDAFATKCLSISGACKVAGIHYNTFYLWTDPNSSMYDALFAAEVVKARETGVDVVEDRLLKATAGKGKAAVTAQIFTLKCRRRAIFGDKAQLEVRGDFTLRDLMLIAATPETKTPEGSGSA